MLIENSQQINIGTNTFKRHTPKRSTGVRIERSFDITFTGYSVLDEDPNGQASGASLLELNDCQRINISGSQFVNGAPYGIDVVDSSHVSITGCTVHDTREKLKSKHAIRFSGKGGGNLVAMNSVGATLQAPVSGGEQAGMTEQGNVIEIAE